MTAILLFALYLFVGTLLLALIGVEALPSSYDWEKPTLLNRVAVFFMSPWLVVLMAVFTLVEDEDPTADTLWEYIESLLRFVWLGQDEDTNIDG